VWFVEHKALILVKRCKGTAGFTFFCNYLGCQYDTSLRQSVGYTVTYEYVSSHS
jgi:hypothetical protein